MHSAKAGPGVLLQAADSTPAALEITTVAPGQVTETSRSPGAQVRSQLLLGAQLSWCTKCSPVEPAGPGGPGGPAGPATPGGPGGPWGPASPCCPAGPCGPFEQATSESAASIATAAIDARISSPLCYSRRREVFIRAGWCQCAPDCVGSLTFARLRPKAVEPVRAVKALVERIRHSLSTQRRMRKARVTSKAPRELTFASGPLMLTFA